MFKEKKYKIMAGFSGLLLLVSQLLAQKLWLYWIFPWFDIYMHFLGGLFFGLIFMGWFPLIKIFNFKPLLKITIFLLVVGIGWEMFELFMSYKYGINLQPSYKDTLADIFFDLAGGYLAYLIYLFDKKYE